MSSSYILCVFGSGGVGKSCLTMQFVQGVFHAKYDPTIEDVYQKSVEIDAKQYALQIYDTAGSDEFSSMRDMYIQSGHGFVLVYSITSPATFSDVSKYYDRILTIKDVETHGPPSLVLVGNKSDLQAERAVPRADGQALAKKWNCTYLESSAKDRANVNEIFYDLVRQINRKSRISIKSIDLSEPVIEFQKPPPTAPAPTQTNPKENRCCILL